MGQANTKAIAANIKGLLQGLTYQNAPLYSLVRVGAIKDPTDILSYAAITFQSRNTKRHDSGWRLNSTPIFQIESGINTNDPEAAETTIMDIGDILTSLFATHYAINNAPGVYVDLLDMDDKAAYRVSPTSGDIYRVHFCYCKAVQQYNVTLQP